MISEGQTIDTLLQEIKQLRQELAEANSIVEAIKHGEIDALLISNKLNDQDKLSDQVYILKGADHIYRVLVEEMQEGCATISSNGIILLCNKNFADIVKTPLEQVIGSSIFNFLTPRDGAVFTNFISIHHGSIKTECSLKTGDEFCAPVILSAVNITVEGVNLICAVVTDLTTQRRSERFVQMIFNQVREPIIACDRHGRIIKANPAAFTMFGGELAGNHFDTAIPLFCEFGGTEFRLNQIINSDSNYDIEVQYKRQDGKVLNLIINASHFNMDEDANSMGYIITLKDITEKRLFTKELSRLDRLNLIGEMAAGIGHEVRNPMTTVRGYLQMFQLKKKYADDHEQFHIMIEELDRANSIITEFLSLAKNKRVELKPGNLNGTIHALFPLLQADAMRLGYKIQTDIGDIPVICYDDKEIRQLILNLVRNAMEAMKLGGAVSIKTYADNDEIILAVQDTGTGIPKHIMDKLGTPFMTTKDGGTGLGLSVCYRIAERHGAKIDVKTSSEGTTFFIKFKAMIAICTTHYV